MSFRVRRSRRGISLAYFFLTNFLDSSSAYGFARNDTVVKNAPSVFEDEERPPELARPMFGNGTSFLTILRRVECLLFPIRVQFARRRHVIFLPNAHSHDQGDRYG